jgi:hypothetical protein
MMALVCVTIVTGAAAIRKPADWSQDRLMLSTIVNLDRMAERSDAGTSFGERPY